MPHYIAWYIPNKVYYLQVWGETEALVIPEIAKALEELLGHNPTPRVHGIIDLTHHRSKDLKLGAVLKEVRKLQHLIRHLDWTLVVVDQVAPSNKMIAAIAHILGFQVRFFDKPEEAMAFLNQQDASLPPLRALFAAYKAKHFKTEVSAT